MIRLLFVAVLVIAVLAAVIYVIWLGIQAVLKHEKQKQLARYAPDMLEHGDIPAPVANRIVELQQLNAEAAEIMNGVLHRDGYFGGDDMESWLKKYDQKELTR